MKLKALSEMLIKLKSVETKLTSEFEKKTGFSLTRYEILEFLKDKGDSSQADIADYLCIDRAAVTRHVKILEEKNYVLRERNKENGREIIVSLTDFSRNELAKCRERQKENSFNLPLPFTQEEIDSLIKILEEIENKLEQA